MFKVKELDMRGINAKVGIVTYMDCAHYLPNHPFCGDVHGHTYKVEIVVSGNTDSNGMVVDFRTLKALVKEVLAKYDHQLLNKVLPWETPTAEILAYHIFLGLTEKLPKGCIVLEKVRVWEGEGKYAEVS